MWFNSIWWVLYGIKPPIGNDGDRMKVFLCEKPSVGEAVAQGLGLTATAKGGAIVQGDIAVTWARGHILEELEPEDYDPKLKKWSLAALPIVPSNWQVKVKESTRSQFHVVDKLIKSAHTVVLATDYDREGEVIGRSILDYCKFRGKVTRIKVTSMDDISMKEALSNEVNGDLSLPIYYAGLGRQRGDWLVGMNLTRYFTLLVQSKGLQDVYSVGRVQTPTLNLIVARDREIECFVSHPFYENQVTFDSHGVTFKALWTPPLDILDDDKHLCNKIIAENVAAELNGKTAMVKRKICNTERSAPPLPLNMSEVQILASKQWGFSAKQTTEILQNLYEKYKLTTYPRTDCRFLKIEMRAEIPETILAILATDHNIQPLIDKLDLTLESKAWDSTEITAHHAIIPTRVPGKLDALTEDERKIYLLVRDHYLVQFMPHYEEDKTTIELLSGIHTLIAKGGVTKVVGWKAVIKSDEQSEKVQLPNLSEQQLCQITGIKIHTGKTTPPNHYTEGTLVEAMKGAARLVDDPLLKKILKETTGIATEATRAGIIENLKTKGTITVSGKKLISSPKGRALIDIVPEDIKSVGMTALWEQKLDDIAARKGSLDAFTQSLIEFVSGITGAVPPEIDVSELQHHCPNCKKALRLVVKKGKGGYKFWGCTGYPECNSTFNHKNGKPDFSPKKTGVTKK